MFSAARAYRLRIPIVAAAASPESDAGFERGANDAPGVLDAAPATDSTSAATVGVPARVSGARR